MKPTPPVPFIRLIRSLPVALLAPRPPSAPDTPPARAVGRSVALLLFLLAGSPHGYSGTAGNGAAQRAAANAAANPQSAPLSPAQHATEALFKNPAPAGPGGITLNAEPLGPVIGTGAGHYDPLPIITNGGGRTLVAAAKGSRVQAYVDGQPGPIVDSIPVTQSMRQQALGSTTGSPQFSADQKRVAYIVGLDNNKQAVVVDGTMGPAYDNNGVRWLSFALTGHHFAYAVVRSIGPNGLGDQETFVVDDGKAGRIYQYVGPAVFSP